MSTCVKCGSHLFRVQQIEPTGSTFILYFVQCSSCGVPVGVMEYNNLGAMIEELKSQVSKINNELDSISHEVHKIRNHLKAY